MGVKIFGYSPSSISHTSPSTMRDIPAYQMSGMSSSFGALPVCLYVYSGTQWVPCEAGWLK
jgi:hypothetical protein